MIDPLASSANGDAATDTIGAPARPRARALVDDNDMWLVGQIAMLFVKRGNMRAAEIMRRLWEAGADRVEIDLPPCDDLPGVADAHAAVIRLTAAGRLDLRQAQALSRLLMNQGRALEREMEFAGFAERIAEIEAANRAQEVRDEARLPDELKTSPPAPSSSAPGADTRTRRVIHPSGYRASVAAIADKAARFQPRGPLPEPRHYPYEMADGVGNAAMTAPAPD